MHFYKIKMMFCDKFIGNYIQLGICISPALSYRGESVSHLQHKSLVCHTERSECISPSAQESNW